MSSQVYDVAVVGAGVTGAAVARRLSAYELDVALLEKECDVSFGVSKANSGIIHGGFHHNARHLKARLEVRGNVMYDQLQQELGFPFKRCGVLVAAFSTEELKSIGHLYQQGVDNGAIGIEMCSRDRMLELEPKLSEDVVGGLHAPNGGIVEPYRLVFALVESARKNGVQLHTTFRVVAAERGSEHYTIRAESGATVRARFVVNAAGLYADEVSRVFGAEEFRILPRKGQYYLLDKLTRGCPDRVLFPVPTKVSKGMLVIPTVHGTVLVGPTADEGDDKADVATTQEQLDRIFDSARRMVPSISINDVITAFSGLRPTMEGDDFFIAVSDKAPRFVQAAGIQSPGLTASPAVAEYVKDLLKKAGCGLTEKTDFDPTLDRVARIASLTASEVDELASRKPEYGNVVCRCETVSEAEVIEAIRRGHVTLDGIKFFTRAGMGRCQGAFCTYRILNTLMRETGLGFEELTKRGGASRILSGRL
jgi:glycerol-3-phosphate dehydrogenase